MTGHVKIVVEDARRELDGRFKVDLAATLRGKSSAKVRRIAFDSVRKLFTPEDFDWLVAEPLEVTVKPGAGRTPLGTFPAIYDGRTFKQFIGYVDYDFGSDETAARSFFAFDFERRPLTNPEDPKERRRFAASVVESEHLPEEGAAA